MSYLLTALQSQLIGQDDVLPEVADLLECAAEGMHYSGQPIASVLALGPTGCGKTSSAIIICQSLYGDPDEHMARFDMSEYMVPESIHSFLESFGEKYTHTGGRGILLFDEIEKADSKILDLLLQILSAARITMIGGNVLDLSQYIVIATSNIGARVLMESMEASYELIRDRTLSAAIQELRPELLPRFDLKAVYNKIGFKSALAIANLHAHECLAVMRKLGHEIYIAEKAMDHMARTGFSELFGARPIRNHVMRVISRSVKRKQIGTEPIRGTIEYFPTKDWIGIL